MRPLWLWPAVSGLAGVMLALALAQIRFDRDSGFRAVMWPGDAAAASTMVQAVATSVISVTALTFSLTVVALQLASQQFSPRLLREFTRDPVTRLVLAILVGTFALALSALRELRATEPVPVLVVVAVFLMGFVALAALLGFITHIVRVLRVDTMMLTVHDQTARAIDHFYPRYGDQQPRSPAELRLVPQQGALIAATKSGFVHLIDVAGLVEGARDQDGVVQVQVRAGDHVVRGAPLAKAWDHGGGPPADMAALIKVVTDTVLIGYERTLEQDAAYGFRQLQDIAVKALSPGINDPVTAAHSIGHMSDLLVQISGRRLGAILHEDSDGIGRAVVPDRDLRYYLDLACSQARRYGAKEPTVLVALLGMLRDVVTASRDDRQRLDIARQADLVVEAASTDLLVTERDEVTAMRGRVDYALAGRVEAAYTDRAGETRSS